MKILDWFKPKDKRNVVIPSSEVGPLRGAALIRTFSTEDEPKVRDFPKEKYNVYWEIFIDAVPGGYGALVRFYSYQNGILSEHRFIEADLMDLRKNVSNTILTTMEKNRK